MGLVLEFQVSAYLRLVIEEVEDLTKDCRVCYRTLKDEKAGSVVSIIRL